MKYLLPVLAVVIILAVVIDFGKKKKNSGVQDANLDAFHYYIVRLSYYDGKEPDTVLFYYPHLPTLSDIQVHNSESNVSYSWDVPQIWNTTLFDDKVYYGVKNIEVLTDSISLRKAQTLRKPIFHKENN